MWYSDIKNWPKSFESRQLMVNGSDDFLEYLSKGEDYIKLHIKTTPFDDSCHLVKNPKELDIWSNDYFLQLVEMIQYE